MARYVNTANGNVRHFSDLEIKRFGAKRILNAGYVREELKKEEVIFDEEPVKIDAKEKIKLINQCMSPEKLAELMQGETRKSVIRAGEEKQKLL